MKTFDVKYKLVAYDEGTVIASSREEAVRILKEEVNEDIKEWGTLDNDVWEFQVEVEEDE